MNLNHTEFKQGHAAHVGAFQTQSGGDIVMNAAASSIKEASSHYEISKLPNELMVSALRIVSGVKGLMHDFEQAISPKSPAINGLSFGPTNGKAR